MSKSKQASASFEATIVGGIVAVVVVLVDAGELMENV